MAKKEEMTFEDMVDEGVKAVIRSFGKGEDLHGAVWYIVNATARWAHEKATKEKASA